MVLPAGGLTLGRVADHDPAAPQRDAADLAGGGEAGPATSGEAGLLEEAEQVDALREGAEGLDVLREPGVRGGEQATCPGRCGDERGRAHRATTRDRRTMPRSPKPAEVRHPRATTTAPPHTAARARNHEDAASVPVPSACNIANGHSA